MRILLVAATALLAQASAAAPADTQPKAAPVAQAGPRQFAVPPALAKKECRKPTRYQADSVSAWRGKPLAPRKLTELPPATSYMAVYRTIDGCEEPMTVAEYRRSARP